MIVAPTSQAPIKILPTATSLKFSSVLKTNIGLANNCAKHLDDSVLPEPAIPAAIIE